METYLKTFPLRQANSIETGFFNPTRRQPVDTTDATSAGGTYRPGRASGQS